MRRHIYVHRNEPATTFDLSVTYAQLQEKIKAGKWEAQTDMRRSGSYGRQEIRVVGTGKVMQVEVEEIPESVKDALTSHGRTTRPVTVRGFASSPMYDGKIIPAGTAVKFVSGGWVVESVADVVRILGAGDIGRHDAEHYYMWVPQHFVTMDASPITRHQYRGYEIQEHNHNGACFVARPGGQPISGHDYKSLAEAKAAIDDIHEAASRFQSTFGSKDAAGDFTFIIGEIEHGGDEESSLDDLRRAGCKNIRVTGRGGDSIRVTCTLPAGVTTREQLQAKLTFAVIDSAYADRARVAQLARDAGELSKEEIAEIKTEKRRKGWSEREIADYIEEQRKGKHAQEQSRGERFPAKDEDKHYELIYPGGKMEKIDSWDQVIARATEFMKKAMEAGHGHTLMTVYTVRGGKRSDYGPQTLRSIYLLK